MTEVNRLPALPTASLGKNKIKTGPGAEKQFLNIGAARLLHAAPFVDGYQNRGLYAAARHHLRPLGESSIKELTKPGFRFLQLPGAQLIPHQLLYD